MRDLYKKIAFVVAIQIGTVAFFRGSIAMAVVGGETVTQSDPLALSAVEIIGYLHDPRDFDFRYRCSGTLIVPDVVATAAHCIYEFDGRLVRKSKMKVVFSLQEPAKLTEANSRGVIDFADGGFNPKAGPKGSDLNDIALLRLDAAAPASYHPAGLANKIPDFELNPQLEVSFAGYGITFPDDVAMRTAGVLRTGRALVHGFEGTGKMELTLETFDQKHVHQSSCEADSGGPIYLREANQVKLLGVFSRGDDRCDAFQIYTLVPAFLEFIDSTIKKWSQAPAVK